MTPKTHNRDKNSNHLDPNQLRGQISVTVLLLSLLPTATVAAALLSAAFTLKSTTGLPPFSPPPAPSNDILALTLDPTPNVFLLASLSDSGVITETPFTFLPIP
jgi:hypothetical protein